MKNNQKTIKQLMREEKAKWDLELAIFDNFGRRKRAKNEVS